MDGQYNEDEVRQDPAVDFIVYNREGTILRFGQCQEGVDQSIDAGETCMFAFGRPNLHKVEDGKVCSLDEQALHAFDAEARRLAALALLDDTDKWVVRLMETGKPLPDGVAEAREQARQDAST